MVKKLPERSLAGFQAPAWEPLSCKAPAWPFFGNLDIQKPIPKRELGNGQHGSCLNTDRRLQVIGFLAMFAGVQTLALAFFWYAQPDHHIDDFESDQRDYSGPHDRQSDRFGLDDELV